MKSKITIVGLGTDSGDELTLGALKALEQAEQVILRTENHGTASFLREKGILFTSLDDIYNNSETFDRLYPEMINRIKATAEKGDVVLGYPAIL